LQQVIESSTNSSSFEHCGCSIVVSAIIVPACRLHYQLLLRCHTGAYNGKRSTNGELLSSNFSTACASLGSAAGVFGGD